MRHMTCGRFCRAPASGQPHKVVTTAAVQDTDCCPAGNANAPSPSPLIAAPANQNLRLPKGPIAGLVVGCVAAVALTFTAALFFMFQVGAPQQPSSLQLQQHCGSRHC